MLSYPILITPWPNRKEFKEGLQIKCCLLFCVLDCASPDVHGIKCQHICHRRNVARHCKKICNRQCTWNSAHFGRAAETLGPNLTKIPMESWFPDQMLLMLWKQDSLFEAGLLGSHFNTNFNHPLIAIQIRNLSLLQHHHIIFKESSISQIFFYRDSMGVHEMKPPERCQWYEFFNTGICDSVVIIQEEHFECRQQCEAPRINISGFRNDVEKHFSRSPDTPKGTIPQP